MSRSLRYFFVLLVTIFWITQLAMAQVTFSKGWGPGKRAALYDSDCRVNAKSLAMIHSLMVEIKHLLACDHQAAVNYLQTVDH